MGRLIEKCQFGPPGGFTVDRKEIEKRNKAFSALRKGVARKGLNVLGWVGDAFSGLLASAAVPSGSATGATVYANSPMYRYNLTHVQPEAKKVIDRAAPYISPANHITAWTQGSWDPMVGAQKLQELGPEAQLLGAAFDMLTFTKGKPAITKVSKGTVSAVDRGLAATGSKGAKGRIVAREVNKAVDQGVQPQQPVFPGMVGWGEKQTFHGYHASNEANFQPNFFFNGWAQQTYNAPFGIYFAEGTGPQSGFLTKRPYVHQAEVDLDRPMVQVGEVKGTSKNSMRNQIERDSQQQGADGIIFQDIADNQMQHQTILKTLNPDVPIRLTGDKVSSPGAPSNEFTRYNREPVIMGDEWGAWEVDYPDYVKHRVDKVKQQVESSNGKVQGHDYNAMPGSVIQQHMQKQGFHPYYVLHPGANLRGQLAETTRRLNNIAGRDWVRNKQMYLDGTAPYYLGYFDEAGIAGSHNMKNGINLIEPNPHSKMHLDMMHEGISHGTDNYMPQTVIDNYQSFVDKVMNHPDINPDKTTYRYKGWSESIPSGTDKWYELRATMGEIRKDMYDRISKDKGVKVNESTIESLRPEFEKQVDAMTQDQAVETLRKTNSYGRVYGTLGPTINPSFLGEFKGLLKLAPVVGVPLIFKYNEEK